MKKVFLFFSFVLIFVLSGCSSLVFEYSDVSFSLKTDTEGTVLGDIPNGIRLISSEEAFHEFLASDFFNDEFSTDFLAENTKYDSDFFSEHDLIAIIYHAPSGTITDVNVKSVKMEDQEIFVILQNEPDTEHGTDDMGRYFTFYIVIEKTDQSVKGISFDVK